MSEILQFPHCDPRILHAPGECEFCDYHPEWQALRKAWGISFTGHLDKSMIPCPADLARGDLHQRWPGNIAETDEIKDSREKYWKHLEELLKKEDGSSK